MKNGIWGYLTDSDCRFRVHAAHGFYKSMPDDVYLKRYYKARTGRELNLENPQTFNEKLQWLKLHDRNPLYTKLVDKYEVKQYVGERIGFEYIIPTYGVWERFDDIDFKALPNQFVLKCTHDSGGLFIVKDKSTFDKNAARKKIEHCLKRNFYWLGREWPYKNVVPRIIVEEYVEDSATQELRDYKFFCFDGMVRAMFVATNRQSKTPTTFDFFDVEYNHLDVRQGHPNAQTIPAKPVNFDLMKTLAAKLSVGRPNLRVDFYEVNGKVLFGELTLFHFDGMTPFDPPEWDLTFGSWLKLPQK